MRAVLGFGEPTVQGMLREADSQAFGRAASGCAETLDLDLTPWRVRPPAGRSRTGPSSSPVLKRPEWQPLPRNQLNDWNDASSFPGLLAEVGVLGVDAVGKGPGGGAGPLLARQSPHGTEPAPGELEQVGIELPGGVDREPRADPCGEPADRAIKGTAGRVRIHVAQLAPGHAAGVSVLAGARRECSRASVPASIALANATSERQPGAATWSPKRKTPSPRSIAGRSRQVVPGGPARRCGHPSPGAGAR
jgi:hypothetical protein